jgi:hypothetical protein
MGRAFTKKEEGKGERERKGEGERERVLRRLTMTERDYENCKLDEVQKIETRRGLAFER